jgi:pilus assembly protein Flp/PilA
MRERIHEKNCSKPWKNTFRGRVARKIEDNFLLDPAGLSSYRPWHTRAPSGKSKPKGKPEMTLLYVIHKLQSLTNEEGQDLVEYALLVALIALVCISGVSNVATAVNNVFSNISSSLA